MMLRDIVPFPEFWQTFRKDSPARDAIALVVRVLEKKLGAQMIYDSAALPHQRADLADLFELAEKLRAAGVIQSFGPRGPVSDEPRMRMWLTTYRDGEESTAGGISVDDDRAAFTAALAESVERKIWHEQTDHFLDAHVFTVAEIQRMGDALLPERFVGFSDAQRAAHPHLTLRDDASYLWIRGTRLPDETPVYLPAQMVSAALHTHASQHNNEPVIAHPITTGLATWPTRNGALLRGLLESIERDAFMITWLNQLAAPRFDTDTLCAQSPSLAKLVASCRRYRFEPHFVRLITDAPTYVVCAVLDDLTGNAPRYAHGLKANANPARAAEGALCEALRARRPARSFIHERKPHAPPLQAKNVGHFTRLLYWAEGERSKHLEFFHTGPVTSAETPWQYDTDAEHLERLFSWIAERKYACASVSLTHSRINVTPWHIEFVVVPELQPMHLRERWPYPGGARLVEVPSALGYTPRATPYLDEPHPFA